MKKKLITLLLVVCVVCCTLCLVACNKDNDVEVSGITLDETQITIDRYSTTSLVATISPSNATNQKLEWSSSQLNVAVVEDGYVAAIGVGTTTITAKSNNGKTAKCEVTVKENKDDNFVLELDVKFDPNGGKFADNTIEPIKKTVKWGDHLDPVTVTRDGEYEFEGWYIKGQPYTGAWNFDSTGVFGDTTLYAKWKYLNSYEEVMIALENRIQDEYQKENIENIENVEVDILSIYKDNDGYLCFIEKDRYGVTTYKTDISNFDGINAEVISQITDTDLTSIDSYNYYYNSDNYSYIADYLPGKYIDGECLVIYGCVRDWVFYEDDFYTQAKGPYYSCEVKALMVDGEGNVFTYSATIVSGTTNFNSVVGGSFLSKDLNAVITPLGDLANDYYSEYLKSMDADTYL